METTIIIDTDSINFDFIEGLKKLFPHMTVEITIKSADSSEYSLNELSSDQELEDKTESYQKKKSRKAKGKEEEKNYQIPGEPLTDVELANLVKEAEKGPFITLEEHNKRMKEWIEQQKSS
jgi:hypothetical protein